MSEDVVHLPSDPGPLGDPGLLLVQLLLAIGSKGPLAQRQQRLAAGPDEHPHPLAATASDMTNKTTVMGPVVGL